MTATSKAPDRVNSELPGRRLLAATAVTHYSKAPQWDLPELGAARQRIIDLFTGTFDYMLVRDFGLNLTQYQLTKRLRKICRQARPQDYVVIYIAGHGEVLDGSGEHLLLTADVDPDDIEDALPTAELARKMLRGTSVQRLLLLLDTCYSGQGSNRIAAAALTDVTRDWGGVPGSGFVVVSSAQPAEQARAAALPELLTRAAEALPTAGSALPALDLAAVVEAMNRDCDRPAYQRIGWMPVGLTGELPAFLPNPHYRAKITDADLRLQHVTEWNARAEQREVEYQRHFLARVMGGPDEQAGWWFSGRHVVLTEIARWLGAPSSSPAALVVTAGPGSGKTAVLGLVAALVDPERRRAVPRDTIGLPDAAIPPLGAIDVAIYAGHLTAEQVLKELTSAAGVTAETVGELLIGVQTRSRPFTALIDAIDEARDPRQLVTRLLRPLIEYGQSHGVRLLLGTRPHLLPLLCPEPSDSDLSSAVMAISLDEEPYTDPEALTAYVTRGLLQSSPESPYQDASPALIRTVVDAVAKSAGRSFLVARITSAMLAAAGAVPGEVAEGWEANLPQAPGDAMRDDLDSRLGSDAQRARDLLLPLAYAEGRGLPWEDIWAPIASAIAGREYADDDLVWLRRVAASYVVEAAEEGRSVYRLYHQVLADHLRGASDDTATQAAITNALIARVPHGGDGVRDWSRAHPYIRRYLSRHAAAAGSLDQLLMTPHFLLTADPAQLLSVLHKATAPEALSIAGVYRRAAAQLRDKSADEAVSYLELYAWEVGLKDFAKQIRALRAPGTWSVTWADLKHSDPHEKLGRHRDGVDALIVTKVRDQQLAITAGAGVVRLWDLAERMPVAKPLAIGKGRVHALAVTELNGRPALITAGSTQRTALAVRASLQLWDINTYERMGPSFGKFKGIIHDIITTRIGGAPVAVAVVGTDWGKGSARHIRAWNLKTRELIHDPFPGAAIDWTAVSSTAIGRVRGKVIVAFEDEKARVIRIWDAALGRPLGATLARSDPRRPMSHMGIYEYKDRAVLAYSVDFVSLREVTSLSYVFDLFSGEPIGEFFHHGGFGDQAICEVNGKLMLITGSDVSDGWSADGVIDVQDLSEERIAYDPLVAYDHSINSLAVAAIGEGQRIISGSGDGWVRIWDLERDLSQAQKENVSRTEYREEARSQLNPVSACALAEVNGATVIVSTDHKRPVMWDLGKGNRIDHPLTNASRHGAADRLAKPVFGIGVSELRGRPVLIGSSQSYPSGRLRTYNLSNGKPIGPEVSTEYQEAWTVATIGGRPLTLMASQHNGRYEAQGWDLASGKPIGPHHPIGYRGQTILTEINGHVALVNADHTDVLVRDLASGALLLGPLIGHRDHVSSLAVSEVAGTTMLAVGDWGNVRVWDLADGSLIYGPVPQHLRRVTAVNISQLGDQVLILSGGQDGSICARRISDRKMLFRIEVGSDVLALMPTPDNQIVACTELGLIVLRPGKIDKKVRRPGHRGKS